MVLVEVIGQQINQMRGRKMNLYLISQDENEDYDTYDSAVVAAKDEQSARLTNPGWMPEGEVWDGTVDGYSEWTNAGNVSVKLIGVSNSDVAGIICSSYNAG